MQKDRYELCLSCDTYSDQCHRDRKADFSGVLQGLWGSGDRELTGNWIHV